MNDELYSVVFTGRLVEGVSGKQALENLTQLFRKSPEEVRKVFSKPGTVIRSSLPLIKAERMLAGLTKAGVVCQLQPTPVAATDVAPSPLVDVPVDSPQILVLKPGSTDLTLSPIGCGRLAAHNGGLETARLDRSFVAYTDILAAAVFSPKESSVNLQLLLFTAGHKRPLLIEGLQIAFSDFPDVPSVNLPSSLRNFLFYLVAQNPELRVDEKTSAYMRGAVPPLFQDDPVLLASQVHAALVISGAELERTPLTASAPGSVAVPRPINRPVAQLLPEAHQSDSPAPIREIDLRAELDSWVDHWPLPLAIVLLAGFLLPLLKRSMLFDNVHLVWFWNLLGLGLDGQQVAAMATYSAGQGGEVYALLPLISAVLVLLTAFAVPKRWRGPILFTAGIVPLSLAFTLFYRGGEIFGIIFLPVTAAGGGMMLALLLAALLVAVVNHLGKQAIVHSHLRILQMVGGLVLLVMTVLAFIAPDWNNFSLYLLYLVWLAIALLAINSTISGSNNARNQALISLLFRVCLILTPIAVVVAQSMYDNPYVTYVVESDGGVIPLVIASLKAFLIYFGMAMATGVGLVQMLGRRYAGR